VEDESVLVASRSDQIKTTFEYSVTSRERER
jgi:hypothetical protein